MHLCEFEVISNKSGDKAYLIVGNIVIHQRSCHSLILFMNYPLS
jgi:hypothetical protein